MASAPAEDDSVLLASDSPAALAVADAYSSSASEVGSDDEADDDNPGGIGSDPAPASFADQSVWKTPSAYIVHHLVKSLPPEREPLPATSVYS